MEERVKRVLLQYPIVDVEMLQHKWNHPRYIGLDKKRVMLVVTMVTTEKGKFVWHSAARIVNKNKSTVKERETWMAAENLRASNIIMAELESVGVPMTEFQFPSQYGSHMIKDMTEEELELLKEYNPSMFGVVVTDMEEVEADGTGSERPTSEEIKDSEG